MILLLFCRQGRLDLLASLKFMLLSLSHWLLGSCVLSMLRFAEGIAGLSSSKTSPILDQLGLANSSTPVALGRGPVALLLHVVSACLSCCLCLGKAVSRMYSATCRAYHVHLHPCSVTILNGKVLHAIMHGLHCLT